MANQLNTSFYIYFTIHSCSNGQELVEKSSIPLCAMFCDAKCDILSQVTGTSLCGIADYQVIKLLTVYSASTSDYEICHGDMWQKCTCIPTSQVWVFAGGMYLKPLPPSKTCQLALGFSLPVTIPTPSKQRRVLVISLYFLCVWYFFLQSSVNDQQRRSYIWPLMDKTMLVMPLFKQSICLFVLFKLTFIFSRHIPAETKYYRSTGEVISQPTTSLRHIHVLKTELVDIDEGLWSPPNLCAETKSEMHASSPMVILSSKSDNLTSKAKPVKGRTGLPSFGKLKSGHDLSVLIQPTPCKGK